MMRSGSALRDGRRGRARRPRRRHDVALALEVDAQPERDARVVLDDEHASADCALSLWRLRRRVLHAEARSLARVWAPARGECGRSSPCPSRSRRRRGRCARGRCASRSRGRGRCLRACARGDRRCGRTSRRCGGARRAGCPSPLSRHLERHAPFASRYDAQRHDRRRAAVLVRVREQVHERVDDRAAIDEHLGEIRRRPAPRSRAAASVRSGANASAALFDDVGTRSSRLRS